MDRLLDLQPRDGHDRTSLRDIFASTSCFPLFLPATSRQVIQQISTRYQKSRPVDESTCPVGELTCPVGELTSSLPPRAFRSSYRPPPDRSALAIENHDLLVN
jgi:hypothetical protein